MNEIEMFDADHLPSGVNELVDKVMKTLDYETEKIKVRTKKFIDETNQSINEASARMEKVGDKAKEELEEVAKSIGLSYHFLSYNYLSRLLFSILFFLLSGYINALSATISSWLAPIVYIYDYDVRTILFNFSILIT